MFSARECDRILTHSDRFSGCFYALDYVPGFEREFDLTDTSIQHSFTQHERVPVGSVF
jgi:hypothetical protein